MLITLEHLTAICPHAKRARLEIFVEPLNATCNEFAIDSFGRQTPFIAQVTHESLGFARLLEMASGDHYEPPSKLAERLGNTEPGGGRRYKGRGLMQITGRKNYGLCAAALDLPLLERPELLEEPVNACRSAGWFWTEGAGLNLGPSALKFGVPHGVNLNDLADAGDFEGITLAINGGLNGYPDRLAHFRDAQGALT